MVDVFDRHGVRFDPRLAGCSRFVRHSDYTALEAQLAERGKTEREIEYDVYSKIRLAFRRALSELPEIAPLEISRVLSSVHMRDEFINEGKRLQRAHGTDAVAPRVEQECGAGAWSFMRKGILSALEATPPAPMVTEADMEWLFEFRENWVNDGSRPNYQQMAKAYAAKMHPWEAAASIYEGRFEDALTAAQEEGRAALEREQ